VRLAESSIVSDPPLRTFTVAEYHRLADIGVLGLEEHVELIEGRILCKFTEGQPRRWTVDEYYRAAEAGILRPDERLELIEGEIYCMSPQNRRHRAAILLAQSAFQAAFGEGWVVLVQMPLTLAPHSEPEPDLAVVRGTPRDLIARSFDEAALVVEVSDTTLRFDRRRKAALYARAAVPEYWVLNLRDRVLEVHRAPDMATGKYRTITRHREDEYVSPLAATGASVAVRDLLP
jgi:Uma2 family endonuclease